jgi:hypothetical protein
MLVLALSVMCAPALWAADRGGRAEYAGGTTPQFRAGDDGAVFTTHRSQFFFITKREKLAVPYENINLIEYGQKVSRRYVMSVLVSPLLMMAKTRKHFLTLGYTDAEGNQQALVLQVNKDDIRATLAALEARTGVKVTYQDEDARKGGKG